MKKNVKLLRNNCFNNIVQGKTADGATFYTYTESETERLKRELETTRELLKDIIIIFSHTFKLEKPIPDKIGDIIIQRTEDFNKKHTMAMLKIFGTKPRTRENFMESIKGIMQASRLDPIRFK